METLQRTANRGSVSTGFDVANSLKLESDNSERLQKTPSGAGNRRTFTISFWTKRTEINGVKQYLFEAGNSDSNTDRFTLRFGTGDTFDIQSQSTWLVTNRVFRDTSAWYHFVIKVDTTDGTAANRIKLYVNGVEETSFSTDNRSSLNQNNDFPVNNTEDHIIGNSQIEGSNYYNGYIAEWVQLDGTAALPTSFGEFDSDTGIWKPKDVSGLTFGTNGFYLDFEDSSNMGNDASGGTDFSLTNITAADQATDTCTNNFCTWNPLWAYAYSLTINEGATKLAGSQNQWQGAKGTFGLQNGRWYWEVKSGTQANSGFFGIQTDGEDNISSGNAQTQDSTYCRKTDGNDIFTVGGSESTSSHGGGNMSNDDILGIFLDLESSTKTLRWFRNGSSYGSTINLASVSTSFTTREVFPFHAMYGSSTTNQYNFGGYRTYTISSAVADSNGYGAFEYTPNDGTYDYYAICTKNLAEYG